MAKARSDTEVTVGGMRAFRAEGELVSKDETLSKSEKRGRPTTERGR